MDGDTGAIFKADCPSRAILDQVADKWSVLVLAALCDEPVRFNVLKRRLNGITQKALTHCLRRLERNGIVSRAVRIGPPVSVAYALTPLGRTLEEPFAALYAWTQRYLPQLEAARIQYDAAERD